MPAAKCQANLALLVLHMQDVYMYSACSWRDDILGSKRLFTYVGVSCLN